jgi:hypothetical protein
MRVLKNQRPPRTLEMNGRGMTDQLWACVTRWWSQDPSQRGSLHTIHTRNIISAIEARRLLDSIAGLSFSNSSHTDAIFNALDELAWWDVTELDNDLAVEWIVRIYTVRSLPLPVPNTHPLPPGARKCLAVESAVRQGPSPTTQAVRAYAKPPRTLRAPRDLRRGPAHTNMPDGHF